MSIYTHVCVCVFEIREGEDREKVRVITDT